jgi:PBP1b-binding outer membrane lipoprotein LpoB
MSRLRTAGAVALLALSCAGCATVLPNTAQAIAPADFTDVGLALAADIEQWVQLALIFAGI